MDLEAIERELAEKRKELSVLQRQTIQAKQLGAQRILMMSIRAGAFVLGLALGFSAVALERVYDPIVDYSEPPGCP